MAIQGLRTSGNFATSERPLNWREGILLRYPNGSAPLTALTAAMKSRSVDDAEFNWWEKAVQTRQLTLGANLTTAGTEITVASGALSVKNGDVLRVNNTGELLRIAADPTSDTKLTVQRAYTGVVAATAVTYNGTGVNPTLAVIGSSYEEGSSAPTGVNFDPTKVYNYTQIFRNTLEATRTALKTRLRTKDQAKEAKRECLELHSIDMERAFWFGERFEGTKNGKPIRTTRGLLNWIDSGNIVTADTTTGWDMGDLETYMEQAFRYGSSEKMCFTGNIGMLTIQQIIRKAKGISWQLMSGDKEFGMNVSRLICPFGTLVLKTHPLFNQMPGGTTGTGAYYGVNSWLWILDMAELQYVYLKDSDTKYEPKLQDNGVDGLKSGYISECGLEVHHSLNHFLIKNLALAAAEA